MFTPSKTMRETAFSPDEIRGLTNVLKESHTSLIRGYVPKNTDVAYGYNGKFGAGYAIITHNKNSTQYAYVTYYLVKA